MLPRRQRMADRAVGRVVALSRGFEHLVCGVVDIDPVVTQAAGHLVGAIAADDQIGSISAVEQVVADLSADDVVAVVAVDDVVSISTCDSIVPISSMERGS
ncbi:hypothetical protein MesoLjLc_34500 [Mesorhizobium sp. L-8-10]|nr:hypothetical protein MesoLjLc_34500 [Mesorhizobium sp. L-8-10]